jgi:phage shock protein A
MRNKLASAFKRLSRRLLSFIGFDVESDEMRGPDALVDAERDKLREQINQFNQTLAASAQLCAVLKAQLQKLQAEESALRLELRSTATLTRSGLKGPLEKRLRSLALDSAEVARQLQEAEATFANINTIRDAAIAKAREKLGEMTELASTVKAHHRKS